MRRSVSQEEECAIVRMKAVGNIWEAAIHERQCTMELSMDSFTKTGSCLCLCEVVARLFRMTFLFGRDTQSSTGRPWTGICNQQRWSPAVFRVDSRHRACSEGMEKDGGERRER